MAHRYCFCPTDTPFLLHCPTAPTAPWPPIAWWHRVTVTVMQVTVTLSAVEGVCAALDGVPQMLELPPGRAVAAPLTLVALHPGDIPITITARGPWGLGDRVTRVLHVEVRSVGSPPVTWVTSGVP